MSHSRVMCRLRLGFSVLNAALWTVRALHATRRGLRNGGVTTRVPAAPSLPPRAGHGVELVLGRTNGTCLERAMVLQEWLRAQGRPVDVVIGVATDGGDFRAHAWVDCEISDSEASEYREIHRIRATRRTVDPPTGSVERTRESAHADQQR